MKRVEANDAEAINQLASRYYRGDKGFLQDYEKANELWLRAGELGCGKSYHNVANSYCYGEGAENDMKKAKHYYKLAAMGGNVDARYNLAGIEGNAGNINRAMRHFIIAAGAGDDGSLVEIRKGYMKGHVTKNDFEKALRAHKAANDEVKSDQRDAAAAALSASRGRH